MGRKAKIQKPVATGEIDQRSDEKFRVQLDFSGKALNELDQLKELLSASARAEVIRNALRWFYWCANEVESGATILVERSGKQREVVFPFSIKATVKDASMKAV